MATPWTFAQRIAAYKAAGIKKIVIVKGAETRNRDGATGKAFGPVHGVLIHHTAGRDSKSTVTNGTASLPGPLCHDLLAKDGTLYVIGHGRTNHAGSCTPAVRDAIVDEKKPVASMRNGTESVDANDFLFGLEIENLGDGKDPYPTAQYDVAVKWAYAHLKHYGWSENSAWGHKELTTRKIDPTFDMNEFRGLVGELLDGAPAQEEEDVALSAADIQKIAQAVWDLDVVPASAPPFANSDYDTNKTWTAKYAAGDAVLKGRQARAEVAGLKQQVADLNAKLEAVSNLGPVNLDLLATKVADLLAQRLAS